MGKHYVDERVSELRIQMYELKREVANLMETVAMLSKEINTKLDKVDVLITSKQVEQLKNAQERIERSNGNIDQSCEHEWFNVRIPGDDGIYVACPKCKSVDVEETRRLSRELRIINEGEYLKGGE